MKAWTKRWAALTTLLVAIPEAVGATTGTPTTLMSNTVCMSLPVFLVLVLLPAEDIVSGISQRIGIDSKQSDE